MDKLSETLSLNILNTTTTINSTSVLTPSGQAAKSIGSGGGGANGGSGGGSGGGNSVTVSTSTGKVIMANAVHEDLVRSLRHLLTAVTRILLLADNVVVKQLLLIGNSLNAAANSLVDGSSFDGGGGGGVQGSGPGGAVVVPGDPRVSGHDVVVGLSNKSMGTMHHFTEFVKAFCDFGSEMIQLVKLTTSKCHIFYSSTYFPNIPPDFCYF